MLWQEKLEPLEMPKYCKEISGRTEKGTKLMNKAIVLGRLTSDPEKRVTTTGKPVTSFTLAIDLLGMLPEQRNRLFLPCVIWGKAAEMVADSCKKGQRLLVEGRIQVRNYENRKVRNAM